VDRKEKSSGL